MHKVMTRTGRRPFTGRAEHAPAAPDAPDAPDERTHSTGARERTPFLAGDRATPPPLTPTGPPRTPGGGPAGTTGAGGRPPASARARRPSTRPADTRPPTSPGNRRPASPGPRTTPRRSPNGTTPPPAVPSDPALPRTTPQGSPRVPARTPRRPLPRPLPTDLFADLLVAVLSGHRPVHSMLRHTRGRAYDELAWLAERGPLRTRGARPVVRDIGYCEPRPGAIEAFARIGAGDRLRAMAFRLELGQDLRWRCTAVELGGPRPPRADSD
ncbi:Rv3235 family protein [Streptomyces sp. NPDC057794]|uniref:Rv3235 family protein n=1 Tax=Streptomyces sp. NPDC057794 TaxID=3346251 RepID=UPI0036A10FB3